MRKIKTPESVVASRKLVPSLITEETLEHIQSQPGRGHIKKQEIFEILDDPNRQVEKNKSDATADLLVEGMSDNGKSLVVCVKLRSGNPYKSEVVTAWEAN